MLCDRFYQEVLLINAGIQPTHVCCLKQQLCYTSAVSEQQLGQINFDLIHNRKLSKLIQADAVEQLNFGFKAKDLSCCLANSGN